MTNNLIIVEYKLFTYAVYLLDGDIFLSTLIQSSDVARSHLNPGEIIQEVRLLHRVMYTVCKCGTIPEGWWTDDIILNFSINFLPLSSFDLGLGDIIPPMICTHASNLIKQIEF